MATREQGNIDGYSIYTPPCEKGTPYAYERIFERSRRVSRRSSVESIDLLGLRPSSSVVLIALLSLSLFLTMIGTHVHVLSYVQPLTKLPPYDPCTAFYSTSYMNLPDVQKAMHANTSGFIEYPWQLCRYGFI